MKKIVLFLLITLCTSLLSFAESVLLLDGYASYTAPLVSSQTALYLGSLKSSVNGGANIEFRPVKNLGITGGLSIFSHKNDILDIDTSRITNVTLGVKGILPFGDRFVAAAGLNGGYYNYNRGNFNYSGLSAGALLSLDFKLSPSFSVYLGGNYNYFFHNSFSMADAGISAGVKLNLSKAFDKQGNLSVEVVEMDPVFPALYSWYNENPFATIALYNEEEYSITDVEVSFYQEEFMTSEKKYKTIKKIQKNDFAEIDLTAFFTESILSLIEPVEKNSTLKINYKLLGEKRTIELPVSINFFNRNNMSWADDRRAAVFVSPNDAEAKSFAKQVKAIVRDYIKPEKNLNAQLAMALFESLKIYGLNYVIDPASSYSANVGSASIDFLQFPYQTLNYRGGDCDDLSILYCSLLETLGIEGAFITVPGHIFTGFCIGETDEEIAYKDSGVLQNGLVYYEGKIWQPIEITMLKDGYDKACAYGVHEWEKYLEEACLYPIHSSWELYSSVNSPETKKSISVQDSNKLITDFKNQLGNIN
ncbi:MAG: porin family protein [Treponema sp.]|nr:porin family protein [Treponema sp.]